VFNNKGRVSINLSRVDGVLTPSGDENNFHSIAVAK